MRNPKPIPPPNYSELGKSALKRWFPSPAPKYPMKLIDHYRNDLAPLTTKERRVRRMHWFNAAKRTLNMLSITSDPVPPLHIDHEGTTTAPYAPFWLHRDIDELVELYREARPKVRPVQKR